MEKTTHRKIIVAYLDHAPFEGGAEVSLKQLISHLDDSVSPVVIAPPGASYLSEVVSRAVIIPFVFHWRWYSTFLVLLFDWIRLLVILRRVKPDIIHTNTRVTNILGGLLKKCTAAPIINHIRDKDPLPAWKFRLIGKADCLIANSERVKQFLVDGQIPADKIHVVYNGISVDNFVPVAEGHYDRKGCTVTFIGQIYPRKGVDILLRAVSDIHQQIRGMHVWIVGEDNTLNKNYLHEYQLLAKELGLENIVEWLGYRTDTIDLLRDSDIFVLPSREEPFGRVLIEAMAVGLPVLATRVGGIPEIVEDGETGYLIPSEDHKTLGRKLIELYNNPLLRKEMGKRGRQRVITCFSLQQHINAIRSLYDRVQ